MNHIIGLDLSLTATGWAKREGETTTFGTITGEGSGMPRLIKIETDVKDVVYPYCELVVMEGLSFQSNAPSAKERAGLSYILQRSFYYCQLLCVQVPPLLLKKFVIGNAKNAEKSLMLREVYKRWGIDAGNDNEADAIGLVMIGACLLGEMEPQNEAQREVLATISASHPGMFPNIAPAAKKPKKRKKQRNTQ